MVVRRPLFSNNRRKKKRCRAAVAAAGHPHIEQLPQERRRCGIGQQTDAAGAEHPAHFLHYGVRLRIVVEGIAAEHGVKGTVGKGQLLRFAQVERHLRPQLFSGYCQHFGR